MLYLPIQLFFKSKTFFFTFLLLFSLFIYAEDKIIYGIPGESTATIDIPKAYAGKEGQIVFIVSGENTYIGEAYSPTGKIYSYLGPKTTQAQINILSQSKSTYITSLEHGTYTFRAGYLQNGELLVNPLGRISSVYITVIDVDPEIPVEDSTPPAEEEEENHNSSCCCHCNCCCNCNNNSDASLALINALYTCISNLQNTMQQEDTAIRESLYQYVLHLESAISSNNTQLKNYLETQLINLQNTHKLDIKELREIIAQEIANLQNAITNVNSNLSTLEKEFALTTNQLQHAISNNASNISDLQKQLENQFNQLVQENNSLAQELFSSIEELEILYQEKIKNLTNKHNEDITELLTNNQNDKTYLENKIKELTNTFNEALNQLKIEHQTSITKVENSISNLDFKLTTLITQYTNTLRLEAANNNLALENKLKELENSLQSSLNNRLNKYLTLINKEIVNTQNKIKNLSSNNTQELQAQLAILKENQKTTINQIEEKYKNLLKDSSLTTTNKALLESQRQSEIATTLLKYAKEENSLNQLLQEINSSQSSSTLLDLLQNLTNLQQKTQTALESNNINSKIETINANSDFFKQLDQDDINEKLTKLQAQLDAINKINNLSIEDVILQLQTSNIKNNENLEDLKLVLSAYVDTVKKDLTNQINGMTKLIEETEKVLSKKISNIEDRLRYFLMTDEELNQLVEKTNKEVTNYSLLIAQINSQINQLKANNKDTSSLEEELILLTNQYDEAKEKQNNLTIVVNLREDSELALHRDWIAKLQTLTQSLQNQVDTNQKVITQQNQEIANLKDSLSNLEKAFNQELKTLEEKLKIALENGDNQVRQEIEDLINKVNTLSDNVKSIASNGYFPGNSSVNYRDNRFSSSTSNIPIDDRDLRTGVNSNLIF